MSCREIIKELKSNKHLGLFQHKKIRDRIEIHENKLLPLNNPYIGVFPWGWVVPVPNTCDKATVPNTCDKATQTDDCKYYKLGCKVANAYGDGWELLS